MLRWFYSALFGAQQQCSQSLILCAAIGQGYFPALNSSAEQQLLPAAFPFVKQWITAQTFTAHVGLSSACSSPSLLLSWNAMIRGVSSLFSYFQKQCPNHLCCNFHALWWVIHCVIHLPLKKTNRPLRCSLILYIASSCFFTTLCWLSLSTLSYCYSNFTSPATSSRYCLRIDPSPFFSIPCKSFAMQCSPFFGTQVSPLISSCFYSLFNCCFALVE